MSIKLAEFDSEINKVNAS